MCDYNKEGKFNNRCLENEHEVLRSYMKDYTLSFVKKIKSFSSELYLLRYNTSGAASKSISSKYVIMKIIEDDVNPSSIEREVCNYIKAYVNADAAPKVYDYWRCKNNIGRCVIITDYFPMTLKKYLDENTKIEIKDEASFIKALYIMRYCVNVIFKIIKLNVLANIYHLDLHPENIVVNTITSETYFVDFAYSEVSLNTPKNKDFIIFNRYLKEEYVESNNTKNEMIKLFCALLEDYISGNKIFPESKNLVDAFCKKINDCIKESLLSYYQNNKQYLKIVNRLF